jgi:predicted TIM-barrel enzyme
VLVFDDAHTSPICVKNDDDQPFTDKMLPPLVAVVVVAVATCDKYVHLHVSVQTLRMVEPVAFHVKKSVKSMK